MKKKITLITSILLIIALAVTFVGCNKDKTEETPTTEASEKVSTTEPTTDEPTTEEATEETTEESTASTTKKPTYSYNSGSSSGSSSNKGSSSTTKASSSNSSKDLMEGETLEDGRIVVVTNSNGGGVFISSDWGENTGGHGSWEDSMTDPDVLEAEGCTDYGR